MRLFPLLLACVVLAGAAQAQQPDAVELARLDGFVKGLTAADQFSSVVLVAHDGKVLFERAYGKRDERLDDPATTDTRYNLASAGKMFTSVAIWQQIAAGRLTLDTTIGAILPDYPNRVFAAKATVRQLLSHTSGAGEIDLFGTENAANRARLTTPAQMIAAFGARPSLFEPGTRQDYSNLGFVILGRMVEVLSHERYDAYVQRHIFDPAGMTRTGFTPCATQAPDLAPGYAMVGGKRVSNCLTQPAKGLPAGGTISTAGDMFRFVDALRKGRLIPLGLLAEATRPYRQFMGLGFFATDYGPGHAPRDFRWGHAGSSDGACADVRTYPQTGETVVVLTNRDAPACFPVSNFLHREFADKR